MSADTPEIPAPARPLNFIEQIIEADIASGKWGTWTQADAGIPAKLTADGKEHGAVPGPARRIGKPRIHTRFPPEPNGWLHIGHAKSICLNMGLAARYDGKFNLRFDDTNPTKEEMEYVEAIMRDVKWLGADYSNPDWSGGGGGGGGGEGGGGGIYWASDYFDHMYEFAKELILKGKAYVDELSADEVAKRRGTPSIPGTSPFRDRPPAESMKLFREMKAGKHPDGKMTLRARIDLASPNFNLRDPVMYRIMHAPHHNTGTKWCVYPMYDWAHGLEDSLEGITHSICTLEFENHRPLYDWFIDAINEGRSPDQQINKPIWHSQQIEFAKLIPTYTILSKRNLLKMVQDKVVSGWDDPRMPTIAGSRRRGYTPEAFRTFCEDIGVTKTDSLIDIGRLENAVREHLNRVAPRYMAVLRPLKVIIDNWPRGADGKPQVEMLDCINNPEDPSAGSRKVPFSGELYIEREDFMEIPAKKFFRLTPGQEVRFRWAYFLKCVGCDKDAEGNITAVHCTYDPDTKGGDAPKGPDGLPARKVKGTIHWVSAPHAVKAEVRLFDRLFKAEEPGKATGNFMDDFNANSLEVLEAHLEPALAQIKYESDTTEGFTPGEY
ncbi:MAG TPA: glutamine--tRNA ligase/YqeY domain fusion protein, partial [Phycisphaerales bacterium]|nr:glutamine--tRNA ligase/YqeY domain fusion protein [Phycisphaerales bacterium]